jgi:hypothetical protein
MKKLLVFAAALVFCVSQVPASTIIDHFENPAGSNEIFNVSPAVPTVYGPVTQGPGLVGVVGGRRDFTLDITTPSQPSSTVVVQFSPGGGIHFVNYENGPGVVSTLAIEYGDGGPLGLDWTGESALTFRILHADFGGSADVTLTDGLATTQTVNVPFPSVGGLPVLLSTPLSGFNTIDFTSGIDKIVIKLTGPDDWDLRLDLVGTTGGVPEPATLLLLGLGAVPLVRRIRRFV